MDTAAALKIRTDMARTMGQKAEAMRREALDEVLRYEGALGCLAQIDQALVSESASIKEAVDGSGEAEPLDLGDGQQQMAGITKAQGCVATLKETALAHLASLRGRVAQSERTLDMLEALFTADIEAAQALVDNPPEAPPANQGQHPGPSLAAQRRAQDVIAEDTVDLSQTVSGESPAE